MGTCRSLGCYSEEHTNGYCLHHWIHAGASRNDPPERPTESKSTARTPRTDLWHEVFAPAQRDLDQAIGFQRSGRHDLACLASQRAAYSASQALILWANGTMDMDGYPTIGVVRAFTKATFSKNMGSGEFLVGFVQKAHLLDDLCDPIKRMSFAAYGTHESSQAIQASTDILGFIKRTIDSNPS